MRIKKVKIDGDRTVTVRTLRMREIREAFEGAEKRDRLYFVDAVYGVPIEIFAIATGMDIDEVDDLFEDDLDKIEEALRETNPRFSKFVQEDLRKSRERVLKSLTS